MFKTGDIFTKEELFEKGLSQNDIDLMVSEGKLCKYEKVDDVYYVGGTVEVFGKSIDVVPLPSEVIAKKYFGNNFELGSWSGLSLMNKLGLCTQVPVVETLISTNVDADLNLNLLSTKYNICKIYGLFNFKFNLLKTVDSYFNYIDCANDIILSVLSNYVSIEEMLKYAKDNDLFNLIKLTNEVI